MSKGIGFYGEQFFVIKSDKDLVSESIMRIIMTNTGERIDNPYFGVNLKNYVFEANDDTTNKEIKHLIRSQIAQYEPRAYISDIKVNQVDNDITFEIKFIMRDDRSQALQSVTIQFNTAGAPTNV